MATGTERAAWRGDQPVVDVHTHVAPDRVEEALGYVDRVGLETVVDITPNTEEQSSLFGHNCP